MAQPARSAATMTVEEFIAHDFPDVQVELVRGEPRMTPLPGGAHGVVCGNLLAALTPHVSAHRLGRVFAGGVGYELVELPHTVRGPDVSFVRAERLPASGVGPGLLRMAPDLAVQVLSPSETAALLDEKLADYIVGGTSLIWVVDPERRTVMVVSANAPVHWLRVGDVLDGGVTVPGFGCAIGDLFDGLADTHSTSD